MSLHSLCGVTFQEIAQYMSVMHARRHTFYIYILILEFIKRPCRIIQTQDSKVLMMHQHITPIFSSNRKMVCIASLLFKPFSIDLWLEMWLNGHVCTPTSGVNVKERYRELLQITQPHSEDHTLLFNDLHFLMVSLSCKETEITQRLLESLRELAKWDTFQ